MKLQTILISMANSGLQLELEKIHSMEQFTLENIQFLILNMSHIQLMKNKFRNSFGTFNCWWRGWIASSYTSYRFNFEKKEKEENGRTRKRLNRLLLVVK